MNDGIKRFECPQCVYVSAEKRLVEKHQKRKHSFDKSEMEILKTEISETQPQRYGFGDQLTSLPGTMETKIFGNIIVRRSPKQESIGNIVIKYSNNKESNQSFVLAWQSSQPLLMLMIGTGLFEPNTELEST